MGEVVEEVASDSSPAMVGSEHREWRCLCYILEATGAMELSKMGVQSH